MFDMGGEYHCYGADISRSWPIDGKFTQVQREVYTTVFEAQEAVMKQMKAGVSWPKMHRLAGTFGESIIIFYFKYVAQD
jgi:Xaa-Pro dipeptidase